jgi:hypothetical protein
MESVPRWAAIRTRLPDNFCAAGLFNYSLERSSTSWSAPVLQCAFGKANFATAPTWRSFNGVRRSPTLVTPRTCSSSRRSLHFPNGNCRPDVYWSPSPPRSCLDSQSCWPHSRVLQSSPASLWSPAVAQGHRPAPRAGLHVAGSVRGCAAHFGSRQSACSGFLQGLRIRADRHDKNAVRTGVSDVAAAMNCEASSRFKCRVRSSPSISPSRSRRLRWLPRARDRQLSELPLSRAGRPLLAGRDRYGPGSLPQRACRQILTRKQTLSGS